MVLFWEFTYFPVIFGGYLIGRPLSTLASLPGMVSLAVLGPKHWLSLMLTVGNMSLCSEVKWTVLSICYQLRLWWLSCPCKYFSMLDSRCSMEPLH